MQYSVKENVPEDIRKNLDIFDDFTAHLLFHRGITSKDDAEHFLQPDYERDTHDPFLLTGMDRAVDRILDAIEKNEHIVVHTDYDTDGIPAGVALHDFFKKINARFSNYIPHRHNEGYGLSIASVETHHKNGANLILTADCGITDVAAVEKANELGIDVIITDHHLPQEVLPPAYVILNPKLEGNTYPFQELCGAGVAYKLIQALIQKGEFPQISAGWEKWLLDMVGLATVADMVPLQGENRALAYFGLIVLRKSPRPGLRQLLRKMRTNQQTLTEDDIGFMIGPRINAASRMGEPMRAFKLLTTQDEVEAGMLAAELEGINQERKTAVATITREVKKKLEKKHTDVSVIVLGNPNWRPSLLGLVANAVAEEYGCPVFLWGREGNNIIKGSCRSGNDINLVELMTHTEDVFMGFGGHAMSGGFSVHEEAVYTLEEKLTEAYEKLPDSAYVNQEFSVEGELSLEVVSPELLRKLETLAPFGEANTKPLFAFKEVILKDVSWFGKTKDHLKLVLDSVTTPPEAIAFFARRELGDLVDVIKPESKVTLLAHIERDTFRRVPRLRIVKVLT